MDDLLRGLSEWKPFTALVVGDFMLDQHIYGDAERLSPDAPVPILHARRTENRAGGAANVCLDLAALRGGVMAFGVVGEDSHARTLLAELNAKGIRTDGFVVDESRPTTVKQNLVGLAQARHPQKMFRVDFESREPLPSGAVEKLASAVEAALVGVDVVCIEDYAKGVCTPELCERVIAAARSAGKPVFVDPARGVDYAKYRGASAITPNRTEAEEATGLTNSGDGGVEAAEPLARTLLDRLELEACVLTLDRHGALLLVRGEPPVGVPTQARQVYDVTGAGDMFLAGLAAARVNGLSWEDSTRFANAAAGLEVEIFGVEPIPLDRIHHSLLMLGTARDGKVRSWEQARIEASALRAQGKRIVFTNGCFDVLHLGHVSLLERAASLGDHLFIGLNDDASVRRLKGPERPVNEQSDRARVLGALGCVGSIVLFGEDTPERVIETIRPDVLAKGADYSKDRVVGADFVESLGGRVEIIPLVQGRSTTGMIQKMKGVQGGMA